MKASTILPVFVLAACTTSYALTTPTVYQGNGITANTNGAFNGAVGSGSLSLTDDGTTVYGVFTRGTYSETSTPLFNNCLVLYIDSVPGGYSTTAGFKDTQDGNRKAISGYNSSSQYSQLAFAPGFLPDYAISMKPQTPENFGGLWQLANGGSGSLQYKQNVGLSPVNTSNALTYTFSFNLANIGLTPESGQSFTLFGTFISNTGNRSREAIAGDLTPDTATLKGFVPFTQTEFESYTTTVVPEPTSFSLLCLFGMFALLRPRRS